MIESLADKRAAAIYKGIAVRGLHPDIQKRARLKLMVLDAAESLDVLGSQRGNQLHMLQGSRQGQYTRLLHKSKDSLSPRSNQERAPRKSVIPAKAGIQRLA